MLHFYKESQISQSGDIHIEIVGQWLVCDEKVWQYGRKMNDKA